MKGHHLAARRDRRMQRGDIRVADDRLWPPAECRVIDSFENAHHAVAAANAPYRVDGIVGKCGVEIGESQSVVAGQVSLAREHVCSAVRYPAQRSRILDRSLEVVFASE